MEVQRAIDRDIEDGSLAYDLDASWLRFADVEADLEMTLSIEGQRSAIRRPTRVRAYKPVVSAVPLNHRAANEYDIDAEIASEVRLRIAPVPPESRNP